MALVGPEGLGDVYPTKARAVYDITGAGDTVLASGDGRRHVIEFPTYSADALQRLRPLQDDGLVELRPDGLQATSRGRMLLRIIAMCFDRYLPTAAASTPRFSRTV